MDEQQKVYVDLDKLRARMVRDVITEEDVDLLFALLSDLNRQIANATRENATLRARLDTALHTGDMEHARMAALLGATADLLNQLALLTRDDPTYHWRIGGRPLDDAVQALKRSADAVRPQAEDTST